MNILIVGQTGQMGEMLTNVINNSEHTIVAGIGHSNYDNIYTNFNDVKEKADCIIDFSSSDLLEPMLNYAVEYKIPTVIATTGIKNNNIIQQTSKEIPIVYAGNYSLGVNVMEEIVESIAQKLKDFNIEISETHHKFKKDSPSGTANMLFESVNRGRNDSLKKHEGRSGLNEDRQDNEVGIHAIRGGTVVGEHTVSFYGEDEVLQVTHTAFSKRIFAEGALRAAEFIVKKNNGLYDVNDVLGGQP